MNNLKRNKRTSRIAYSRSPKKKFIISISILMMIIGMSTIKSINIFGKTGNINLETSDNTDITLDNQDEIEEYNFDDLIIPELEIIDEESSIDIVEVDTVSTPAISLEEYITNNIGAEIINIDDWVLEKYNLPNIYYPGLDYSTFQPYMDYRTVSNPNTPSYQVSHSVNAYTDENGLRRHVVEEGQISINGKDDYVIALGTYYKEKGTAGSRYLIVTSTGMYTAITGDEKSDYNTDSMNMYSSHGNGKAGLIEWLVDTRYLDKEIKNHGTISAGPVEELSGEILYIYKIN